jgi:hypothetical protein
VEVSHLSKTDPIIHYRSIFLATLEGFHTIDSWLALSSYNNAPNAPSGVRLDFVDN